MQESIQLCINQHIGRWRVYVGMGEEGVSVPFRCLKIIEKCWYELCDFLHFDDEFKANLDFTIKEADPLQGTKLQIYHNYKASS